MRCVFCKQNSSESRSVEHIIPESLGNVTHILPPGIICDRCNNYFAREVEKPFLETPSMSALRFHQMLPNKRGRVPPIQGLLYPKYRAHVTRTLRDNSWSIDLPEDYLRDVPNVTTGALLLPVDLPPPRGRVASRFLAKIALEAFVERLLNNNQSLDLAYDGQLEPIRNHARQGTQIDWPTHVRRIYRADDEWSAEGEEVFQIVHEYDFLVTDQIEIYFVIAIFGVEYTINLGGPDLEGYMTWLGRNDSQSPLYAGNNRNNYTKIAR